VYFLHYAARNTIAIKYSRNNIVDAMDVSLNKLLSRQR